MSIPPLFNMEYSEIGCEVAEDFWKFFMNSEAVQAKQDSPCSPGEVSDYEDPISTSSRHYLESMSQSNEKMFFNRMSDQKTFVKEESYDVDRLSNSESSQEQDFLSLSREDLLKLSSKGLEAYAQSLAASRPLTVDEEKQLKRQRRLIKNRESAQLSRQRKKIYIEDLERQVSALTSENMNLSKKVSTLSVNNHTLVEEVMQLQTNLRNNPEGMSEAISRKRQIQSDQNLRAAGVCLMLVLFSFGLFINSVGNKKNCFLENHNSQRSAKSTYLPNASVKAIMKKDTEDHVICFLENQEHGLDGDISQPGQKRRREDNSQGGDIKRQCFIEGNPEHLVRSPRMNIREEEVDQGLDDSIVTVIIPSDQVVAAKENDLSSFHQGLELRLFPIYMSDSDAHRSHKSALIQEAD